MSTINDLIAQLEMNYYSRLILLITELSALVIGLRKFKTLDTARIFVWYIAFDLSLYISSILIDTFHLIPAPQINKLNDTINLSVSVAEIGIYLYYFKMEVQKTNLKKYFFAIIFTVTTYLFLSVALSKPINKISLSSASYLFSSASFLLIFPLSMISMLDLLKNNQIKKIHREPRFWITIGVLYYSAVSIPFYFFRGFFDMEYKLKVMLDSVLFYTPFTLNLMCLLIAFICKKQVKN